MMMVEFFIPGEPQGKGRPRAGKGGRMYTPAKTVAYEGLVAHAASEAMGEAPPIDGPLRVTIVSRHSIPQSWSKKKQTEAMDGPCTSKPDIDNIVKAVADGGNGVVWVDDKQIASITAMKRYSDRPGVMVMVERM
jgi:Holliday junction resolvase RusA-like endonuclease